MAEMSTESMSVPITCLHVIDNFLLVGEGGCVRCHQLENGQELSQLTVFTGARVHGVTELPVHNADDSGAPPEHRQLIVYGSKQLCQVSLDTGGCLRVVRPAVHLTSWLLDITPLPEGALAALDTHGRLLRLASDLSGQVVPPVRCPDRCILYSGALLPPATSADSLLAFCGTVFCQVLIWEPGDGDCDGPILHRLTGHTGVIFRLTLSPARDSLLSCSDDRSVRQWRRVGSDWLRVAPAAAGALFGHEARVWSALPVGAGRVVSVGEDSRVCLWSPEGRLVRRWRAHAGASVRAAAADSAGRWLVTGGGDGAVLVWPLVGPPAPASLLAAPAGDRARTLRSLDGYRQLLVTDAGRLLLLRRDGDGGVTSELLLHDPRLASYALLAVSPDGERVALAGMQGHVITLRTDGDCLVPAADRQVLDGKVYSLHWLDAGQLLVCDGAGQLHVLTDVGGALCVSRRHQLPPSRQRWVTAAALCPPETLVAADRDGSLYVYLPDRMEPVQTLRRLVGRYGATSITRLSGSGPDVATSPGPSDSGPDVATSPAPPDSGRTLLVTARNGTARRLRVGEDGLLRQTGCLRLPWDWAAAAVQLDGQQAVVGFHGNQLVLWSVSAERELWRVDCGGGHRSWALSVSERHCWLSWVTEGSVRHVTCPLEHLRTTVVTAGIQGGGTLSAALLGPAPDGGSLMALSGQDGTVRLISAGSALSPSLPPLSPSLRPLCTLRGHISAVRAVCAAGSSHLVSAGGRGQVLLWGLTDGGTAALQLSEHRVKPESRRRVEDTPETRYMDLAARADGGTVTVAAAGSDGLVRLLGFRADSPAPDLSLLASVPVADRCLLRLRWLDSARLAVVGTDGALWLWDTPVMTSGEELSRVERTGTGSEESDTESRLNSGLERGSTHELEGVMKEARLKSVEESALDSEDKSESVRESVPDPRHDSSEPSGAMDLRTHPARPAQSPSDPVDPVRLPSLHQSGINALEVASAGAGCATVVTGGDDGAVRLSELSSDGQLTCRAELAPAHGSQVTGVAMLPGGCLLSVAIDQRLCVWRRPAGSDILTMVACHNTPVADVKGLLHWTDRQGRDLVLVYGEGVELVRLDLTGYDRSPNISGSQHR
ncbi:WD repeat-containing protein 6-like [Amphibalanus amphitrite]|uniref:WD repeat-containing protein 6-like n=1 Tax=Amphibalanus amphitrite TaxID=1232801 RepID=UPI001C91FC74|nr:WD repeat-containing protein 6-like [Amphibalanus amphitrite]